jgi:DNA polymerase-3 subunit epsilon
LLPDQLAPVADRVRSNVGVEPGEATESTASSQIDLQRLMIRAEFIRPLAGIRVVLAGKFRMLTADQARDLANRSGALCKEQVDDDTDFMVVDETTRSQAKSETHTGGTTRVISEQEFLHLIHSPNSVR